MITREQRESIPSIESIPGKPWFTERPWLICGTGETLVRFKPEYAKEFNIWCIYYAIDIAGYADILHFQDMESLYQYDTPETFPKTYRHVLVRPRTVQKEWLPDRALAVCYKNDIEVSGLKPQGEIVPTMTSVSFAFYFLARNKIPKIYTLGIDDGTSGVCPGINQNYREITLQNVVNDPKIFKGENAMNAVWCKQNNTEWIKL